MAAETAKAADDGGVLGKQRSPASGVKSVTRAPT
jgi:hypothetical protein